ncbi:YhdP family protein [Gallaecimonas mangrovi]|uniref:YhdP family protein n=1 Tax=Gallaecimonas mangrovi TaxID=2291597 RepID=UPI000E204F09|nr:YhdP family protein [Gallaecimonas mangrovi]
MGRLHAVLGWLARKAWLLLAIILLLAALLVSAARLLVHRLDDVRPYLVDKANSQWGLHLVIDQAKGDWQGLGPKFDFEGVSLTDPDGNIKLHVKELSVGLRFWASLFSMEPKLAFLNADGMKLNVERWPKSDDDDSTDNASSGDKESPSHRHGRHQLELLFLRQLSTAKLTNSEIELPSRYGYRTIEISKMSWLGGRYRHQAVGYASIREYGDQQVRFILDLYGLASRVKDLDARLYVDAQDLHLDPWVNTFLGDSLTIDKGTLNSQLWLDFSKGKAVGGEMLLKDSALSFDHHQIKVNHWALSFNATDGGWQLDSRDADVSTDGKPWELGQLQFRQQRHDHLLYAQRLRLAPLTPLLNLWRSLPPPIKGWLAVARPNGEIRDLYLAANHHWELSGNATVDMNWSAKDKLPGMKNLKVKLSWAGTQGIARFDDSDVTIDPGPHFRAPFTISRLQGDIWLLYDNHTWQMRTGQFQAKTEDLAFAARGKMDFGDNPSLALKVDVSKVNVGKVGNYLPLTVMPTKVSDYLTAALKGGTGKGVVLWQGPLHSFPFSDNAGTFLATADVSDLDFNFDDHWPDLLSPSTQVRFEDAGMLLSAPKSTLAAVPVANLTAAIPNLGHQPKLHIEGHAKSGAKPVHDLMKASPLADSVGAALDSLVVSGDVKGQLSLDIPLTGGEVLAKGKVDFADNQVRVLDAFDLTAVSGQLDFANDHISATSLEGKLYGQPVSVKLDGKEQTKGYQVNLGLGGRFSADDFNDVDGLKLKGQSHWRGKLGLLIHQGGFNLTANGESDLKGISSPYPFPANKTANEAWPLLVTAKGDENGVDINASLGKRAMGHALFVKNKVQSWQLGVGYAPMPEQVKGAGSLSVGVSALDSGAWSKALAGFHSSGGGGSDFMAPLTQIDANIGKLLAFDQNLDSISAHAKLENNSWRVKLASKEVEGSMWLPVNWGVDPLLVNLDRVDIQTWNKGSGKGGLGAGLKPSDIPPFQFYCASCNILGIKLGQIRVEGRLQGSDLLLPVIKQQNPHGSVSGSGTWLAKDNVTDVDMQAKIDDVGKYVDALGIASSLRDAPAKAQLQLTWPGGPQDFALAKLNGKVDSSLGQGYVADVSDKGARLLTVFSFDSLRRKLALDFRDLFDKGLYFDSIHASGEIKNGVLRSNKIKMDGVVGDMSAEGWTDLVSSKLAYDISFKPNVTGNLPVLAAFAVTPVTGVAVYALTKIFGPVIDVITEIRFNLTGTIDKPHLEEVSRSKGSVTLPKAPESDNNGKTDNKGSAKAATKAASNTGKAASPAAKPTTATAAKSAPTLSVPKESKS